MFAVGCWYCIADYVAMADGLGFRPAIPEGIGFVHLAGPYDEPRWGIFACGEPVRFSDQVHRVSPNVEGRLLLPFDGSRPTSA